MSLTSGFFDSLDGDRKYNTLQLSSIFDGIISDGVYATYGNHFLVSPVSGMQIKVGSGRAWLDHTWTLNSTDYPLTVADAEVVLSRIDTVIIEVDRSNSGRINRLRILKGTPASSPSAPTLTKTDTLKQYPLANIRVKPNATAITTADITNQIGTSALPWVTGIIDHVTADELVTQWRSEFDTLLDTLETMISQAAQGTILDDSITTKKIVDKAVTGAKMADGSITGDKVADKTLTRSKMAADVLGTPIGYVSATSPFNANYNGYLLVAAPTDENKSFTLTADILNSLPTGWTVTIVRGSMANDKTYTLNWAEDIPAIVGFSNDKHAMTWTGAGSISLNTSGDIVTITKWLAADSDQRNRIIITGNKRTVYAGTSNPSGGSPGDIYIQYT